MKMLQSSKYFPVGVGVSGGTITCDSGEQYLVQGSYVCCLPTDPTTTKETYSSINPIFEQSYSGFYNLNNVEHAQVSGCIVSCGSPSQNVDTYKKTVFGPYYKFTIDDSSWYYNYVTMPGETFYQQPRIYGKYNKINTKGTWVMALGITWFSDDTFLSIFGGPDLTGSTRYANTFMFTLNQVVLTSTQFKIRSYYYVSRIRISQFTIPEAISMVREHMINGLEKETFNEFANYTTKNSIRGSLTNQSFSQRLGSVNFSTLFPPKEREPFWPDLARDAYNSVPFFNGNGIALSADLLSLKSSVHATRELISNLISSGTKAKIIAKVFLAFYYGWRLLVLDVGGSSAAFNKASKLDYKQKCSSHLTYESHASTYTSYFHCYYNRYGARRSSIDQLVSMFDAKLSLENLWDLIPFSFVIDWFTNIGSLLESFDSYGDMIQDHKIVCTGRSIKCSANRCATQAGISGCFGVITYSYYWRSYTSYVYFPSLILGDLQNPLIHSIEGTALIVSR